jgi:hypothetical protein
MEIEAVLPTVGNVRSKASRERPRAHPQRFCHTRCEVGPGHRCVHRAPLVLPVCRGQVGNRRRGGALGRTEPW